MAVDGRKLKKPLKGLGKNAQGKNMDLESSGKPEFVEDDTGPEKLTMSDPINDTVNQLSVLYEEKMEQAVERAAKMAAMKVAETMNKEISKLEKQVADKDQEIARLEREKSKPNSNLKKQVELQDTVIARLESEKDRLLNEMTQNESTIEENHLKIDTLMQEKKTLERELQKKEKELQEDKIKAEIELEKVCKELIIEKGLHLQSKCQANIDKAALKKEIAGYKK